METRLNDFDQFLNDFLLLLSETDLQQDKIDALTNKLENIIKCQQPIPIVESTWQTLKLLGSLLLSNLVLWKDPSALRLCFFLSDVSKLIWQKQLKKDAPFLTEHLHSDFAEIYQQLYDRLNRCLPDINNRAHKTNPQPKHPVLTLLKELRNVHFLSIQNADFINPDNLERYLLLLSNYLASSHYSLSTFESSKMETLKKTLVAIASPKGKCYAALGEKNNYHIVIKALFFLRTFYENAKQKKDAELCKKISNKLEKKYGFSGEICQLLLIKGHQSENPEMQRAFYRKIISLAYEKAPLIIHKKIDLEKICNFLTRSYQGLKKIFRFSYLEKNLCRIISSLLEKNCDPNNFTKLNYALDALFNQSVKILSAAIQNLLLDEFLGLLILLIDIKYFKICSHATDEILIDYPNLKKKLEATQKKINAFTQTQASVASLSSDFCDANHALTAHILKLQQEVNYLEKEHKQLHSVLNQLKSKRKSTQYPHTPYAGTLFQAEKKLNEPQQKKAKVSDEHSSIQEQNQPGTKMD